MKNKYWPTLRFSEFQDKYCQKEIAEVADVNPTSVAIPDTFIYIDLESVVDGRLVKENVIEKVNSPSRAQRVLSRGDLLFQMVRPYQKNNLFFDMEGDYVASTGYAQVRSNLGRYLYYYFQKKDFLDKVIEKCTGTSYPAINSTDFSRIKIFVPNEDEQRKVAAFIFSVDFKINVLKEKIESLHQYKKSLLQQLFSGKLRFKDERGREFPEWEEKKVKEIFEVTRGYVLAMNQVAIVQDSTNQYPVYSSQTLQNGLCGFYKDYLYENCITWTTDGANAGNVNFRKGKFYCTNVCGVLISNEGYANELVANILNSISRKYVSYVGNPKLMNNVMAEIPIRIPTSLQEQQKISSFISEIDTKISLCIAELEKMKTFKQGLLQKMFV